MPNKLIVFLLLTSEKQLPGKISQQMLWKYLKERCEDPLHNPITEPIAAEITWSLPSTAMDLKKYITNVNELLTKRYQ